MIVTLLALASLEGARAHDINNSSIIFKETGALLHTTTTVHVSFTMDLRQFKHHCDTLRDTLPGAGTFDLSPAMTRTYRVVSRVTNQTCSEVTHLRGTTAEPRDKRQIMAIAGIIGAGTAFGPYQHHRYLELAQRVHAGEQARHHQLLLIHQAHLQLHQTATVLVQLQRDVEELAQDQVSHIKRMIDIEWLQSRAAHLAEFGLYTWQAHQAIRDLTKGQISTHLLSLEDAERILAKVTKRAKTLAGTTRPPGCSSCQRQLRSWAPFSSWRPST